MSKNNVTAIIITGDSDSVANVINQVNLNSARVSSTALTLADISDSFSPKNDSVEYSAHTWNFSDQRVNGKQYTAAQMYLSKNKLVRFDNLMNYIQTTTNGKPSNAALSNFLRHHNYKRVILKDVSNNTSKIVWKKR